MAAPEPPSWLRAGAGRGPNSQVLELCSRPRTARDIALLRGDIRSIGDVSQTLSDLEKAGLVAVDEHGVWRKVPESAGLADVGSAPRSHDAAAPNVQIRAGAALSALVAAGWSLIFVGLAALGLYYVGQSEEEGSFGEELGDAMGGAAVVAAALGLTVSLGIVKLARDVSRSRRTRVGPIALAVIDAIEVVAAGWLLVETFRTAAGDGHSVNPLYASLWIANVTVSAAAAVLLATGARRDAAQAVG